MKSLMTQAICRFLAIALMVLPFQGHAGMIGTDQATSPASVQAERDLVTGFLSRTQTVNELQAMGVDAQTALDRVAAMTDAEVSTLAGRINAMPAGGESSVILILLLVFVIWWFAFRGR
jgi:hypothetical protein